MQFVTLESLYFLSIATAAVPTAATLKHIKHIFNYYLDISTHLTYNKVIIFINHEQVLSWAYYERDSWKLANAIKRGYSIGKKS